MGDGRKSRSRLSPNLAPKTSSIPTNTAPELSEEPQPGFRSGLGPGEGRLEEDPWQATIRRVEAAAQGDPAMTGDPVEGFRVVGGKPAAPHTYPWLVALFHGSKQFCGGSLIDDRHILTAAHCVAKLTQSQMAGLRCVLGAHDLRRQDVGSTISLPVGNVVYHKAYDANKLINDIAVLTLSSRVEFNNKIKPICLNADPSVPRPAEITRVAGWGSLSEGRPQEKLPQEVNLQVWSNAECGRRFGRIAPAGVPPSYLCAGKEGRDSCLGDSGGPQIVQHRGAWRQVGVVSWGIGCGQGQFPGVYSRMSHFLPWVAEVIQKF